MGIWANIGKYEDVKLSGLMMHCLANLSLRGRMPNIRWEIMSDGTRVLLDDVVILSRDDILRLAAEMWRGIAGCGDYYAHQPLTLQALYGLSADSRKLTALVEWLQLTNEQELVFR